MTTAAADAAKDVGATSDNELRQRICAIAFTQYGQRGFDIGLADIADAAGVEEARVTALFESTQGLRQACDDLIENTVRDAKTAAVSSADPADWSRQLDAIESYAPLMEYLARSLEAGDESSRVLLQRMTDNAERYLELGVQAGTLKPTRDPKGRAHLLAMIGGGSFLLYRRMHPSPDDMAAVLRDYAKELVLPLVELYTEGLISDRAIYDALLKQVGAE